MTNIYVRIERDDGSFANVQIDEMTNTELGRFIMDQRVAGVQDGWNWVKVLALWIRDNVREGSVR